MELLKARLTDGSDVEFFDQSIGSGGEKVAFFTKDKQRVVCFFSDGLSDRMERRRRLEKIIGKYNPTTGPLGDYWKNHFCWPTGLIDGDLSLPSRFLAANQLLDPPLATVCPAYRSNFFFTDRNGSQREKNGKWFTSEKPRKLLPPEERGNLLTSLQVCTKMSRAVRKMHMAGLAHSDLSNKNVLIDPRNGDACLIDIDSLVVPGIAPPSVLGTPGYIAPEVMSGHGHPCIETDQHALAVLIYETLLLRHPLRGPKINSRVSGEEDELFSMGKMAVFIENPVDTSNALRPPPIIPANRLGPYLNALFRRTFVDGLHDRAHRAISGDWESALYKTFNIIHPSPCGTEWFVLAPGMPLKCPATGRTITRPVPYADFYHESKPGQLVHSGDCLTIYHNLLLMKWHTLAKVSPNETCDRTRQGYFSFHNDRWYLVNETGEAMRVVDGATVPNNQAVEVTPGLRLRVSNEPNGRIFAFNFMQP